ncbi:AAA family ATPase [Bacteroides intestinalis]|jgi:uncharacterized AAA domain-containing protein ycf46|uniref:AAA family ATPase n=1 Tax=Bacteroides intestinalis TaxID=329854 RepID=UPI0018A04F34|nr:AAA family ATPase [Bacteroides intestinalis]DAO58285.1 MAG TPA: Ycf46 [Caudoviricetes sp.]
MGNLRYFRDNLEKSLDYRRSLILIESFDTLSVENEIIQTLDKLKSELVAEEWTAGRGSKLLGESNENATRHELTGTIRMVADNSCPTLLVLKDSLRFLNEDEAAASLLKNFVFNNNLRDSNERSVVILIDTITKLPVGMEKLFHRISFPYPDAEDIREELSKEGYRKKFVARVFNNESIFKNLINSLMGLHLYEIRELLDFYSHNDNELGSSSYLIFTEQKKQIVRNTGVIEVVDTKASLGMIGGLDELKSYLIRKQVLMEHAMERGRYNIPAPKGILMIGSPGCGKTLAAKAIATAFKIPLLRLDVGRLMGKYVGESEHNLAHAIQVAEAAQPCVLWIDEIEKAFAGSGGDDNSCSDTTVRHMIGTFLTWLQERESNVFVAATANKMDLPPELMRKGRLDETFYITYPTKEERKEIFKSCLERHNFFNVSEQDMNTLASDKNSNFFSGAEIQSIVQTGVENYFIKETQEKLIPDIMVELALELKRNEMNEYTLKERKEQKDKYIKNNQGWLAASSY